MLSIQLPTYSRDYVISIQKLSREDALTLSYLATRLGADMLGTHAARRIGRAGFTVCWSTARLPEFDAPPDLIVTGEAAPLTDGHASVLALGGAARGACEFAGELAPELTDAAAPVNVEADGAPDAGIAGARATAFGAQSTAGQTAAASGVQRSEAGPEAYAVAQPGAPLVPAARLYTLGAGPHGGAEYIAALCHCPTAYVALGALCRAMGFVPVQLVQQLLSVTVGRTEPHMLCNCVEGAFRGYRQLSLGRGVRAGVGE